MVSDQSKNSFSWIFDDQKIYQKISLFFSVRSNKNDKVYQKWLFLHAIKLACYQTYRDESCNSLHRNFKMGNRNTEDSFEEVSFNYLNLKSSFQYF